METRQRYEYDVVIIGGGPAGLTAGIYCARSGLKTLILEKTVYGGQILKTDTVENYPGFPEGISGFELIEKMKGQAERFGVELANGEAKRVEGRGARASEREVDADSGEKYCCKAVIIAAGAGPKRLGIKGEAKFTGKGVSYCAACDGPLFKGQDIVVVGGGDTAVGEAVYLARFARKLTLLHRRDSLRASKILQDRLLNDRKVKIMWNCAATEILGTDRVDGVKINDIKTGREEEILAGGVFIYVGLAPNTNFMEGKFSLDDKGFIVTDERMRTSVEGVFACGDARKNHFKQVVTACAEGATAAHSCWHYIQELKD